MKRGGKARAAPTRPIVWLAICDDVFDGHGLVGFGSTAEEAKYVLWEKYKEVSPKWNGTKEPFLRDYDALREHFGVTVTRYRMGQAYSHGEHERGGGS